MVFHFVPCAAVLAPSGLLRCLQWPGSAVAGVGLLPPGWPAGPLPWLAVRVSVPPAWAQASDLAARWPG